METVRIKVKDYYGNPSYYSVMPENIFDALELASLKDEEYCSVDKALFYSMLVLYKTKMSGQ